MKLAATILYGSQNYGLDTPESDKDYKVLLCPQFDDLYNYHKVCKDDLPSELDPEHYSVMSLIQFHDLLMAGNPNCIEMLYSMDKKLYDLELQRSNYMGFASNMFETGYIATVWDKFYSALKGITMHSIGRNGINVKTVSRLYYFYYFAQQIVEDGFSINERTWRNPDNMNYCLAAKMRKSNSRNIITLECIADGLHELLDSNEQRYSAMAKKYCEAHKESIKSQKELKATLDRTIRRVVWENCNNDRTRKTLYGIYIFRDIQHVFGM